VFQKPELEKELRRLASGPKRRRVRVCRVLRQPGAIFIGPLKCSSRTIWQSWVHACPLR